MIEIKRVLGAKGELLEGAFRVRRKVFIDEQKVEEYEEFDEFEESSVHFMAVDKGEVVGTARYRTTERGVKLERFAVLSGRRNEGIGHQLLKAVLNEVIQLGFPIYLHAQVSALDFYARNGFVITGKLFVECNIDHYPMEYNK